MDEQKENLNPDNDEKIVVVSGDGSELDISEVRDHLNVEKPKSEVPDKNNIIIPPTKKQ